MTKLLKTTLIFLSFCLVFPSFANPVQFHAEYSAEYQGLPVKASGIRSLTKLENGHYLLSSTARSFMITVTESTEFTVNNDQISPVTYQYERKGLGRNKHEFAEFNWADAKVTHHEGEDPLAPGTLDKLLYQLQLRSDVAAARLSSSETPFEFDYRIRDGDKDKHYRFRLGEEEILTTPLGELNTVRVDRIRDDKKRSTSLWLAVDHQLLLVKLEQKEKDKGFELNLQKATIEGVAL